MANELLHFDLIDKILGPVQSKSSKFKGETQHYVVKLPKSAGARHYCPKILRVPGTLGTHANSSPVEQPKLYFSKITLLLLSKCKKCYSKWLKK